MKVKIHGVIPVSAIDFPEHLSAVVFMQGCNFSCGFCHNPEIVHPTTKPVSVSKVLEGLKKAKKLIDGVVITGGEPTIQPQIVEFVDRIKQLGLKVKLDTNGYEPDILRLLMNGRVDYVAMDIKTCLHKYSLLTNVKFFDIHKITESIHIIMSSTVPYEFRTTVVPGVFDDVDFRQMLQMIQGAKRYVLQKFKPTICLDPEFCKLQYSSARATLEQLQSIAQDYTQEVLIRR